MEPVMCVQPRPWPQPAPEIVAAVAAMYQGKRERPLPVMVRDQLGEWLSDEQFAGAYGRRGKPAWPPGRLALVTIFQMAEDLTDRLVPARGKMRTDSTHVVSAVRDLNRLELAGELVRACLEALAVAAPHVVAHLLDESWGKRYAARTGTWRMPASTTRKDELALAYGRDGRTLLRAVYAAAGSDPDLAFLARLHQVEVLRVVLVQN